MIELPDHFYKIDARPIKEVLNDGTIITAARCDDPDYAWYSNIRIDGHLNSIMEVIVLPDGEIRYQIEHVAVDHFPMSYFTEKFKEIFIIEKGIILNQKNDPWKRKESRKARFIITDKQAERLAKRINDVAPLWSQVAPEYMNEWISEDRIQWKLCNGEKVYYSIVKDRHNPGNLHQELLTSGDYVDLEKEKK